MTFGTIFNLIDTEAAHKKQHTAPPPPPPPTTTIITINPLFQTHTHTHTHLPRHVSLPLKLDGLKRAPRRKHRGAVRPAVGLFGCALCLRRGVREREDNRVLAIPGHLLDHRLVEGFREG